VIITREPKIFSSLRRNAARARFIFPRSTALCVGRAAIVCAALTVLIFSAGPVVADELDNGNDYYYADTTNNPFYNIMAPVTDPAYNSGSYQVADQVAPFSFGAETGTVESWVESGSSNNPYDSNGGGSVDGAMTFVYQISLTSTGGDIAAMGAVNFGFNMTDVGYYDQTGSEVWPSYVSRDLSGNTDDISTVTFSFYDNGGNYSTVNGTDPTTVIDDVTYPVPNPGEPSALLVINTDATTYVQTYVTLQDDANGTTSSYAIYTPMIPTPEPGSIVLMVLGLTGLLAVARARRSGRIGVQDGT
jgi:hypothetical protein